MTGFLRDNKFCVQKGAKLRIIRPKTFSESIAKDLKGFWSINHLERSEKKKGFWQTCQLERSETVKGSWSTCHFERRERLKES